MGITSNKYKINNIYIDGNINKNINNNRNTNKHEMWMNTNECGTRKSRNT